VAAISSIIASVSPRRALAISPSCRFSRTVRPVTMRRSSGT
jgi:hypothetical protein